MSDAEKSSEKIVKGLIYYKANYEVVRRIVWCNYGEICMLKVRKDNSIVVGKILIGYEHVKNEFDIHQSLDHPNVIKTIDSFGYSKIPSESIGPVMYLGLVVEFADGGTLDWYVKNKNFGFEQSQIQGLILQITEGLEYIHACGLIHRDLKPSNIFMVKGTPKIGDFGLAVETQSNGIEPFTEIIGTAAYRAPELLCGLAYENTYDIWSLGVVITDMVFKTNFFGIKGWLLMDEQAKRVYCLTNILKKTGVPKKADFPELRNAITYLYANFNRDLPPEQPDFLEPVRETLGDMGHDFLKCCLTVAPNLRWTSQQLLNHPYLSIDD